MARSVFDRRVTFLTVVAILFLGSCSRESPVGNVPQEEVVLLSVGHVSYWLRFSASGIYVNSAGEVFSYSSSDPDEPWHASSPDTVSQEELFDLFGRNKQLEGRIPRDSAESMRALLDPCFSSELSELRPICCDGTTIVFWAYCHDAAAQKYHRSVLRIFGNAEQRNTAPEARALYNAMLEIAKTYWDGKPQFYVWPFPETPPK